MARLRGDHQNDSSACSSLSESKSSAVNGRMRRRSVVKVSIIGKASPSRPLPARALPVLAPRPTARPTLAFLQLLLGPANAAFSGHILLCILDPADELVASQRGDVLPRIERRGIADQSLAQVSRKLVHHSTGHTRAGHRSTVQRPDSLPTPNLARTGRLHQGPGRCAECPPEQERPENRRGGAWPNVVW